MTIFPALTIPAGKCVAHVSRLKIAPAQGFTLLSVLISNLPVTLEELCEPPQSFVTGGPQSNFQIHSSQQRCEVGSYHHPHSQRKELLQDGRIKPQLSVASNI